MVDSSVQHVMRTLDMETGERLDTREEPEMGRANTNDTLHLRPGTERRRMKPLNMTLQRARVEMGDNIFRQRSQCIGNFGALAILVKVILT